MACSQRPPGRQLYLNNVGLLPDLMNTYCGNSGHLSKRVPERIYYSIWVLLGDLWRGSKETKVCSRLEVIRKWEQFYGWEKQLSLYWSGEEDVCMLWVHNNLVCVCGLDVSCVQQFPYIRCDFLSQKNTLTVFGCEQIYKLKMNLSLQHSYYAKFNFQALSSI